MLFGSKKPDQETVLLLDVESGSVGSALALLKAGANPRLFGEKRIKIPLTYKQGTAALLPQVEKAVREALVHAAEVSGRLRANQKVSPLGNISRAAVFLSAPWGRPNLSEGKQLFVSPLQLSLTNEIDGYLGAPAQFYTGADAAAYASKRIMPGESILVCVVRAETSELLLIGTDEVVGYATIPSGINTMLRTLKSHGGMSEAETHSLFALSNHPNTAPYEPLEAAAQHFVEEFAGAAQHLLAHTSVNGVFVIAPHTMGDWFAKALSTDESLGDYFPHGGTVRALRHHHLTPHVDAHLLTPDLHLLLTALFIGK